VIASLTVDVEPDCPPYLSSWRGMTEGLPRLLDLLDAEDLRATFFVTGDAARRFPEAILAIAWGGHEIGCHGDSHRCFAMLDLREGSAEIARATDALRPFGEVVSFRAPYLQLPRHFLPVLTDHGYRIDSSAGRHKMHGARVEQIDRLTRIPASVTSSTLRWPAGFRDPLLTRLREPAVLFVHPWEFVDLRRERLRFDCRFRTGRAAEECLRSAVRRLREVGAVFTALRDVPAALGR
jgi:peptidoglycan/xylan/chitin deacetylase (PgdA/CDA1 family)